MEPPSTKAAAMVKLLQALQEAHRNTASKTQKALRGGLTRLRNSLRQALACDQGEGPQSDGVGTMHTVLSYPGTGLLRTAPLGGACPPHAVDGGELRHDSLLEAMERAAVDGEAAPTPLHLLLQQRLNRSRAVSTAGVETTLGAAEYVNIDSVDGVAQVHGRATAAAHPRVWDFSRVRQEGGRLYEPIAVALGDGGHFWAYLRRPDVGWCLYNNQQQNGRLQPVAAELVGVEGQLLLQARESQLVVGCLYSRVAEGGAVPAGAAPASSSSSSGGGSEGGSRWGVCVCVCDMC